jgi:hypothetical protein
MTIAMNDRFHVPAADPAYRYRWCNNRDVCMMTRISEGWETVQQPPTALEAAVSNAVGQTGAAPAGGSTISRGDVVLMRMRREDFEKNIALPKRLARERQVASFDTMVAQVNENTQRALRQAGLREIPKEIVYQTSDESSFKADETKKK